MVSLSLLARGSYLDLDVLYGRPCKWTTVLPILVNIYIYIYIGSKSGTCRTVQDMCLGCKETPPPPPHIPISHMGHWLTCMRSNFGFYSKYFTIVCESIYKSNIICLKFKPYAQLFNFMHIAFIPKIDIPRKYYITGR